MADFIIRVELHAATASDYERLHRAMEFQGFSRTIVGGDGRVHQLPTAEYRQTSTLSVEQVRQKVKAVVVTVKPSYEILVVQVAGWSGYLTLAKAKAYG